MIDLSDWQWGGTYPINIWIRVLLHHGNCDEEDDGADCYAEGTARLTEGPDGKRYWTMAPGQHIWGPIVGWRELREGERP